MSDYTSVPNIDGNRIKPLSLFGSLVLFGLPSAYFILVTRYIVPVFRESGIHPALGWFLGGMAVFIPIFFMAVYFVKKESSYLNRKEFFERLRLKKPDKRDIKWVSVSITVIFAISGIIFFLSELITGYFNMPPLNMTPEFAKFEPLEGRQLLLMLVWLVMFFFNIMGEELMWRGYILPRQELRFGKYAWCINAAFWMLFHACFGPGLMIILLPVIVILPYVVQKTGNTTNGVLIHAVFNGPLFILVALGIIK